MYTNCIIIVLTKQITTWVVKLSNVCVGERGFFPPQIKLRFYNTMIIENKILGMQVWISYFF